VLVDLRANASPIMPSIELRLPLGSLHACQQSCRWPSGQTGARHCTLQHATPTSSALPKLEMVVQTEQPLVSPDGSPKSGRIAIGATDQEADQAASLFMSIQGQALAREHGKAT